MKLIKRRYNLPLLVYIPITLFLFTWLHYFSSSISVFMTGGMNLIGIIALSFMLHPKSKLACGTKNTSYLSYLTKVISVQLAIVFLYISLFSTGEHSIPINHTTALITVPAVILTIIYAVLYHQKNKPMQISEVMQALITNENIKICLDFYLKQASIFAVGTTLGICIMKLCYLMNITQGFTFSSVIIASAVFILLSTKVWARTTRWLSYHHYCDLHVIDFIAYA